MNAWDCLGGLITEHHRLVRDGNSVPNALEVSNRVTDQAMATIRKIKTERALICSNRGCRLCASILMVGY